ncbi:MAG: PilT/PilU family type 4a pilus ATPase [Candidatus Shapirobacteria bacterium]|nr:PilT/PilU family type 4a pilus ATPase [Candidatus Shapirobacteria bacterium]
MNTKIQELLDLAVVNKASDLHLMMGMTPKIRVNGELAEVSSFGALSDHLIEEMIFSIISEEQKQKVFLERELDFSLSTTKSRFRGNLYFQKGKIACALRIVNSEIPSFEDLGFPDLFRSFANYKQGFVLVTGPTGHGKSTTVASILDDINSKKNYHIVTVEDPIEYVIKPKKSIISQREIGFDTNNFTNAIRSCLRQDPNVVFLGEMRDLETISAALTIAETGHLVFSVLHTNSAAQTIDRIVDIFPSSSKEQVKTQLASVITAIVSQRLVPDLNGGRVVAMEILMATPAVKNVIREGKTFMIDNIIQTSSDMGMVSLDMSLARLVKEGKISEETALSYCVNPAELQTTLRKIKIL